MTPLLTSSRPLYLTVTVYILCAFFSTLRVYGQKTEPVDITVPRDRIQNIEESIKRYPRGRIYTIKELKAVGSNLIQDNLIISFSGLIVGRKLLFPGSNEIAKAIRSLYDKKLFADIRIEATDIALDSISLLIRIKDRPQLTGYSIKGLSKSQTKDLDTKLDLAVGRSITQHMIDKSVATIRSHFSEKGYNLVDVKTVVKKTTLPDNREALVLEINVKKGKKVRLNRIDFWGNDIYSPFILAKQMKGTRERSRFSLSPKLYKSPKYGGVPHISFKDYVKGFGFLSYTKTKKLIYPYLHLNIFNPSKFDKDKYAEDKQSLISFYNTKGYRDARIVHDSVYTVSPRLLNIDLEVRRGREYYFGNISWKGNTRYSDTLLSAILDIRKGTPYDKGLLEKRLGTGQSQGQSPQGDIMSLYMDNGYLFFRLTPVERRIYSDTIDFEMRIVEGPAATIDKIDIVGNHITKEHVVRRSLRILPGDKFNRSALIRSVREIATLGFFNPETINPQPKPNIEKGTVDILLGLEEKSNDQIEASVSYGQLYGVTGSIGFTLNNFSIQNALKKGGWNPFPRGDAQKLSFRAQFNGPSFQSYSLSFSEPWLGSTAHRTSFSVGLNYSTYTPGGLLATRANSSITSRSKIETLSASVGFGRQLRWPDDFFTLSYGISYTRYILKDYAIFTGFSNGASDNINLKLGLSRSSIDNPIFARTGSRFTATLELTPPYSYIDKSIVQRPISERFALVEYYKVALESEWYFPLTAAHGPEKNKQLVLKLVAKGGFLGKYNPALEITPFERYQVGDAGLAVQSGFLGFDVISHRGYFVYESSDLNTNPETTRASKFFTMYNKYVAELRYPFTFSNSATIFITSYFEAANGWYSFEDFNPFQLRKSVGIGIRFFLPIFGLLGFDYSIGIDRLNESSSSIFDAGKFSFILGYEPQ